MTVYAESDQDYDSSLESSDDHTLTKPNELDVEFKALYQSKKSHRTVVIKVWCTFFQFDEGERYNEIDVLGLLEKGSDIDISLEDYRRLHNFSLEYPDLFWRKVAGWDPDRGWPQEPSAEVQGRNHRYLFFKHHDKPPVDTLKSFSSDSDKPAVEFMKGTETNMCYNLLDRQVNNPEVCKREALI